MGWLSALVIGAAGVASMRAALERGDVDEAARQGMIAGPAAVEQALAAADRPARLAGIAAATSAGELIAARAELLEPLARTAALPDRRVAIPAARAARQIARELRPAARDLPDDLAPADVEAWRAAWAALAGSGDRWIELRVAALETAAALDPTGGTGVDLATALRDPDPAYRRAAIGAVPAPVPVALRAALAGVVINDPDPGVAVDAAAALCGDLVADPPVPILDALGPAGLARIRALGRGDPAASRCVR